MRKDLMKQRSQGLIGVPSSPLIGVVSPVSGFNPNYSHNRQNFALVSQDAADTLGPLTAPDCRMRVVLTIRVQLHCPPRPYNITPPPLVFQTD